MAVPKKKTSHARKNQRRAHHAMGQPNLAACPNCGFYKGRTVVAVEPT